MILSRIASQPRDGGRAAASTLQTADRAPQILQLFPAPDAALSVSDIAARLGLHRTTASRLAGTLEATRFPGAPPPGEATLLGPEMVRLGRLAVGARDLVGAAQQVLDRISSATGETATLAVVASEQAVTVAQANGRHFVSSGNWVGVAAAPHCCSYGKVLLAFGALSNTRDRLARLTTKTISGRSALVRELEEVRRRGFALADGEMEEGLVAIAGAGPGRRRLRRSAVRLGAGLPPRPVDRHGLCARVQASGGGSRGAASGRCDDTGRGAGGLIAHVQPRRRQHASSHP